MRRWMPAAVVVAAIGLLAGCAPAPDLRSEVTQGLRAEVLEAATAASAGDETAARAALDEALAALERAADDDGVTPSRYRQIRNAIADVRAQLDARAAAEAEAARVAAEADAAAAQEREAAELAARLEQMQAELDRAAAEDPAPPAPEPAPEPGKGNDKGNGKGHGKKG